MTPKPPLALLAIALVACGARQSATHRPASTAAPQACEAARAHFQQALAAEARKGDYLDRAVHELNAAYDAVSEPLVLLHVAMVHEEQGDFDNGLLDCRRYLDTKPASPDDVAAYCGVLTRQLARQRILYEKATMGASASPDAQTAALSTLVERYEKRCPQLTSERDICQAVLEEARHERDDPAARIAELDTDDSDAAARARSAMTARAADDPYATCGAR